MQLSDAQLESAKSCIEQKKPAIKWLQDNGIKPSDCRPVEVIEQLRMKYSPEVMDPLIEVMRKEVKKISFGMPVRRMVAHQLTNPNLTKDMCDNLAVVLQDLVVMVRARKEELQK